MDYRFTVEQEAFRKEFADWLAKQIPKGFDPSKRNYYDDDEWKAAYQKFQKSLFEGGYAAMHYEKEYGGQGKTMMEQVIVQQTIATTCGELSMPGGITMGMALPTIHSCCTEAQKREHIPKILDGTYIWCQGFSEPNAGSDVANCATRAVRKNGDYIIDGQKTWTSFAHMADWCILLVRTDPSVAKHKGLSYLLVNMKTPGIEVRPMVQLTEEAEFNEVFFDNVKVPVENRVGEEGQGWMIAITTLMFERTIGDAIMGPMYERNYKRLVDLAKSTLREGKPVIENPVIRQQLAQAYIETMVLKYHGLRNLSKTLKGGIPGPEGSIGKLLWSEPNQRITENALNMQGLNSQVMRGSPWTIQDGNWQYSYLRAKGNTIEAGSSEIQRNIIGERCLLLPKDSSREARRK
ncbi:MAG: acyl-CoA dehydrogenase family protein [Deltaproteobacteria bacterium]|nr:acyl-CoA dehydrogenase family protein [Deltaproteobacteria bacterium]